MYFHVECWRKTLKSCNERVFPSDYETETKENHNYRGCAFTPSHCLIAIRWVDSTKCPFEVCVSQLQHIQLQVSCLAHIIEFYTVKFFNRHLQLKALWKNPWKSRMWEERVKNILCCCTDGCQRNVILLVSIWPNFPSTIIYFHPSATASLCMSSIRLSFIIFLNNSI